MERTTDANPPPPACCGAWWRWFVFPTFALLALTAALGWSGADLRVMAKCYDASAHRWAYGEDTPWLQLFQYGAMPAVAAGMAALLVLLACLVSPRAHRSGKAALYVMLCLVLGCGVLANGLFKENWGRPRPSQLREFGGTQTYVAPLVPHFGGDGKAFPCGHATAGFCFAAFGLLWWKSRRRLALCAFALSTGYGIIIGIARVLQGAHFPSDVAAAAAVCWATTAALYLLLRMDARPAWQPRAFKAHPLLILLSILVAAALIGGAMLATPYQDRIEIIPAYQATDGVPVSEFNIESFGDSRVFFGSDCTAIGQARGFGMPRSRVKWSLKYHQGSARFFTITRGWFTELQQNITFTVPRNRGLHVLLSCPEHPGNWDIDLTSVPAGCDQQWTVREIKDHSVSVRLTRDSPVAVSWLARPGDMPQDVFRPPAATSLTLTVVGPHAPEIISER